MIVKGKFCDLKLLKPKDYNKLYNLRSKLKNDKLIHDIPKNKIFQKIFIENQISEKNFFFGIFEKNKLIGTISIYNLSNDKIAEIGRFVCLNQGIIALEAYKNTINFAFEKLKLKKLLGKTEKTNTKSKNLMKNFLFKEYYINKFETFFGKKHRDIIVYFLNRYDFKKLKKKINKIFYG